MKNHHRSTTLFLALGLLGMAGLLGISRWQQSTPAPASATTTPPDITRASGQNPMPPGLPSRHGERMATEVSQRPAAVSTAPRIDRTAAQPRPGEPTYRLNSLPKARGTYWVENADGTFSRLAVSPPENQPDNSH